MSKSKQQLENKGFILINDFDDALECIGSWGRFQFGLLALSFMCLLTLSYMAYSPILVLYMPSEHYCAPNPKLERILDYNLHLVKELTNVKKEEGNGDVAAEDVIFDQCFMYEYDELLFDEQYISTRVENFTLSHGESSGASETLLSYINMSSSIVGCKHGWIYKNPYNFSTISTELNWVCNDAWRAPFSQSMFFVGGLIGTIIFGFTIDYWGRVPTFMLTNFIALVTGLLTPFCSDFALFVTMRFIMGLSHVTFYTSLIMLAVEYVSNEKRSLVCNLGLAISMTVGGAYQPWLMKYLQDWKLYHWALFGQGIYLILTPMLLHESLRWQATKGLKSQCISTFNAIARRNNREITADIEQAFERYIDKFMIEESNRVRSNIFDLFRSPLLRRQTIILVLTWMLICSMFDGHIRNITNLKFSIMATFTISSLLELPADLAAMWGLDLLGRRWSAFLSLSLSGVAMSLAGFYSDDMTVTTVFAMIGRFFITYSMNTGVQMTMELMPTELRGQGAALTNVFGHLAMFMSPYIVYSNVMDEKLPFIIFATGSLIAAVLSLFLPETANEPLPETCRDAQILAKKSKNFFHVPCLAKFWPKKSQEMQNNSDKDDYRHWKTSNDIKFSDFSGLNKQ